MLGRMGIDPGVILFWLACAGGDSVLSTALWQGISPSIALQTDPADEQRNAFHKACLRSNLALLKTLPDVSSSEADDERWTYA